MTKLPIGVIVESFRKSLPQAIEAAAALGADGIQLYANSIIEYSPAQTQTLLHHVKNYGLVVSAVCGDLGFGFGNKEKNPELIEKSKRIMELAKELETNIVTTHIGVIPNDSKHPRYSIMQQACFELSDYAKNLDMYFAVETGPEPADTLKSFLDSISNGAIRVNMDPANLVMVTGDDPVNAVYTLKDYIVHTHAKDGVKLLDANPEFIYRAVHPVPAEYEGKSFFKEVPLGTGSVPFERYLDALHDIGYTGFLTIEREVGNNPEGDIHTAFKFLKELNSARKARGV